MAALSVDSTSKHLDPPLLAVLQPVRLVLQQFLDDGDGARLLRVSSSTARRLLTGFTFNSHVFLCDFFRDVERMRDLFARYQMLILRVQVSKATMSPPYAPFPPGLVELFLVYYSRHCRTHDCVHWNGQFSGELCPGFLPSSLRLLRLPDSYNTRLVPGGLPSSLTELTLMSYNRTLGVGVLPASLTRLHLIHFNRLLAVGVLPTGLTQLRMNSYNRPLLCGVLPGGLEVLEMARFDLLIAAGVLPNRLERLSLSSLRRGIAFGALPSSLVALHLRSHTAPITLPSSGNLRNVCLGMCRPDVRRGFIPDGVQRVEFHGVDGVVDLSLLLPSSVVELDLRWVLPVVVYFFHNLPATVHTVHLPRGVERAKWGRLRMQRDLH